MNQQAVLFTLNNDDGNSYFWASPEALDWCQTATTDTVCPDTVQRSLQTFGYKQSALHKRVELEEGSMDNDAAIFLHRAAPQFSSARIAFDYARNKGWVIADADYQGALY